MPILRTTTVIRRHFPMVYEKKSKATIGQLVDMRIQEMMSNGEEIQTVAIEFEEGETNRREFGSGVDWDTKL